MIDVQDSRTGKAKVSWSHSLWSFQLNLCLLWGEYLIFFFISFSLTRGFNHLPRNLKWLALNGSFTEGLTMNWTGWPSICNPVKHIQHKRSIITKWTLLIKNIIIRAHESRTICAVVRFLEVPRAQNIGKKPSLFEMDETLSRTKFRKL